MHKTKYFTAIEDALEKSKMSRASHDGYLEIHNKISYLENEMSYFLSTVDSKAHHYNEPTSDNEKEIADNIEKVHKYIEFFVNNVNKNAKRIYDNTKTLADLLFQLDKLVDKSIEQFHEYERRIIRMM